MKDIGEVEKEYDHAIGAVADRPNKYPAMTYEEGVRDALGWVLGEQDEAPISDDE